VTHTAIIIGPDLQLDSNLLPLAVDLIPNYASVTVNQVLLHLYGLQYDLQNHGWSSELLLYSDDSDLSDKVSEKLTKYPISRSGGPLYLWHMSSLIISTSEAASKALLDHLDHIQIHQIEEENMIV